LAYLDLLITNTIAEIIAPLAPNFSDLLVNIISGISPYSYQWNTGDTTTQITPDSNGQYWVIVTDNIGCISDTVFFNVDWIPSLISNLFLNDLVVFPNPSDGLFKIQFNSQVNQSVNLVFYNILGDKIFKEKFELFIGNFEKKINLSNFPKGIYSLEINSKTNKIYKKIIIQ